MNLCTVNVPDSSVPNFRPVVAVKYNGSIRTFARYINRSYCFDTESFTQQSIDDGSLSVEFVSTSSGEVLEIDLN